MTSNIVPIPFLCPLASPLPMNTFYLDQLLQANPASTPSLPDNVLSIGNFDGVHLGHQAMLAETRRQAQQRHLACAVMIFEPQPREYFAALKGTPEAAPVRLTNLQEKQNLLSSHGVDILIVANFNDAFRALSALEFAQLLSEKLAVKALVLGDDFRFGHDRTGNSEFLRNYGLPVTSLDTITDQSLLADRISSTRIRDLLALGDLNAASDLLGRDYSISGEVIKGDQIGRTLDFPTANIALNRAKPALHGVFAVDAVILDTQGQVVENGWQHHASNDSTGIPGLRPHSLFGSANIGTRPSVERPADWRLEVYFPDYQGDLYGKTLNVRFLHYLHSERKYDSLAALKTGIEQDVIEMIAWRHRQG